MKNVRALLKDAECAFSLVMEKTTAQYAFGCFLFVCALALRFVLFPHSTGYAFFTFYPAIALTSLFGGFGPGILVIVLGDIVSDYVLIGPAIGFKLSYEAVVSLTVYTLSGILLCLIVQRNREQEARQSFLGSVVESSEDAIVTKTLQGVITSWNSGAESVFGFSAAEVMGKPWLKLHMPDRVSEDEKLLARIGRGERVIRYQTTRLRKDGQIVDLQVTLSPILGRLGHILGASMIAHDITAQKKAEEDLQESNLKLTMALAELAGNLLEIDKMEGKNALLAAIVSSSNDAIISKSLNGFITSWNAEAERLFGYSAAEALGKSITMLIPPERSGEEARFQASISRGKSILHYETERLRKDGSLITIAVSLAPIRDRNGRIVGVSKIAHDISGSKETERRLAGVQARYQGLLEGAPWGVIATNSRGVIVHVNAELERIFGYKRAELLGNKVEMLIPAALRGTHPAQRESYAQAPSARFMGRDRLLFGLRKDGSEVSIEIMVTPIDDPEGSLMMASIRDISQHKELERNLSLMTARYRGILEGAPYGIVVANKSGDIILVNAEVEKLFGYEREELLGQTVEMLVPLRLRDRHVDLRAELGATPHMRSMGGDRELLGLRKDGTEISIEILLNPIESPEGVLVMASLRDISQRKELEEGLKTTNRQLTAAMFELKRSNQELDEFAYIASHDLKEPLRGIHNYVSFLQEDYASQLDEEGRSFLDRMQRLAERMTKLIDTLLACSRLGSSAFPLEEVNLELVLDEVEEDIIPSLAVHEVTLRREGILPVIQGNALRLGELFQNLIMNAAKYNDKAEKWVEVGWAEKNGLPVFYVRDNGIGIAAQHQESVFRIFKRLHEQSKFGGGTGAGLTIAKKIVERHNGEIWLESTLNEGTTFYFTLRERV